MTRDADWSHNLLLKISLELKKGKSLGSECETGLRVGLYFCDQKGGTTSKLTAQTYKFNYVQ